MSRPPVDFLVWVAIVTVVAVEMVLAPGMWLQLPDGETSSDSAIQAPEALRASNGVNAKR